MQETVYLLGLGCAKNQVDSEIMRGLLQRDGYRLTEDPAAAEIILINTCGFIEAAQREAIEHILELAEYKKHGRCRRLYVCGCLVQGHKEELREALPEVDGFLEVSECGRVCALLAGGAEEKAPLPAADLHLQRQRLSPPHYAYLRIADGCNNRCAYCRIPFIRGPLCSRPMEDILAEAEELAAAGVKELILIAQDSSCYGQDLYGRPRLAELLRALSGLPFLWLRVLYAHPAHVDEELLRTMAELPNVCHYLDIPLQHADDRILAAMNRPERRADLLATLRLARKLMPDLALRTTYLVGFPGEGKQEFASLLDFAREAAFDWAGAFAFSREAGTPAFDKKGQVPQWIKESRYRRLMVLLADISARNMQRYVGRTLTVLIDEPTNAENGFAVGRSQYHAPDVDGVIYVKGKTLAAGDVLPVRIVSADTYDLIGEWVETE